MRVRIFAVVGCLLLASPVGLFYMLQANSGWNPALVAPTEHFWIVSATAILSAVIAASLMIGVRSVRTTRNLFLALGFLAVAMIFATHGLSTPGFFVPFGERPYAVSVSAGLSEVVGATFILLSVMPTWARTDRLAERFSGVVLPAAFLLLIGYGVVAMARPETLSIVPNSGRWDAWLAGGTIAMLGIAAWRYLRAWQLTRFPGQLAMVVALVLLAESQISMYYGELWRLNWWQYHVLMLAAFLTLIAGWAIEAVRARSLVLFSRAIALRDVLDRVSIAHPESLEALEEAMGEKDEYTRHHMGRVAEFSVAIARTLGLDDDRCALVELAGRIHDIGKIAVPDHVLLKPGKLTPDEFRLMQLHSASGEHIAKQSKVFAHLSGVVRHHHEHFAGVGYPDHLTGESIPLEARILSVADAFDAMTSPRVYRPARDAAAALAEIARCAGTQFDPRCVEAFRHWLESAGIIEQPPAAPAA